MRSVSIVLCTLGRPRLLVGVLGDLAAQLPARGEVVVVDQSEGEARRATQAWLAARGDARTRLLCAPPRGLPEARNLGLEQARGEVVLFLDDDVRLAPGCVQAHLRALERPGVGAVVGRVVERGMRPNAPPTVNEVGPDGRVRTNLTGRAPQPVGTLKGANMSLRREVLDQMGPFDSGFRGTALLEDADMGERVWRAGWSVWFEPEAELIHLSAPRGGVRQGSDWETERWRFHNTALFLRKHRPRARARAWATFAAIALRRAAQWRDPAASLRLMAAFEEGWRAAGEGAYSR